jgi:hypothetical protein
MNEREQVLELAKCIAGTLDAMLEIEEEMGMDYIPRSSLYMVFNMDMQKFKIAETVMVQSGLIKITPVTWSLTEEGRKKARQCREALQKAESERN